MSETANSVRQTNEQTNDNPRRKRSAFKRAASKLFGRHKNTETASTEPSPTTSPLSRSSSTPNVRAESTSSVTRSRSSSSAASSSSSSSSSSSRHHGRRREQLNPSRRLSLQSRQNLMSAALPSSGPERLRAARALLSEIEKYDHLQRRSLLRNLPPLQFHITLERRVNGRPQETEIEVSMNELRDQLQEILREESAHNSPLPPPPQIGGLRHIKSKEKGGIADVSVFPTHIHDGRELPSDKQACTVCIEDYVEGDEIKTIPCLHFFHSECIDEWFKRSKCCPNCNITAEVKS